MAAYRRVYDSRHLQADCQEPGSAPEPYARQSSMGCRYLCDVCVQGRVGVSLAARISFPARPSDGQHRRRRRAGGTSGCARRPHGTHVRNEFIRVLRVAFAAYRCGGPVLATPHIPWFVLRKRMSPAETARPIVNRAVIDRRLRPPVLPAGKLL